MLRSLKNVGKEKSVKWILIDNISVSIPECQQEFDAMKIEFVLDKNIVDK
jgi:hypothetical protein